jgi:hypothetical protein
MARRASEHIEVANVLSRNTKAVCFKERGATFCAAKNID